MAGSREFIEQTTWGLDGAEGEKFARVEDNHRYCLGVPKYRLNEYDTTPTQEDLPTQAPQGFHWVVDDPLPVVREKLLSMGPPLLSLAGEACYQYMSVESMEREPHEWYGEASPVAIDYGEVDPEDPTVYRWAIVTCPVVFSIDRDVWAFSQMQGDKRIGWDVAVATPEPDMAGRTWATVDIAHLEAD